MKPRSYQSAALDALFSYFATHTEPDQNPVVAAPTGSGKALIIALFFHKILTWWPGQRVLNLVHVKELVEQNAQTLKRLWPQAPVGVFSAGLGQKVAHMPITFAGVKSVANSLKLFGRMDIIVIDECHLVSEKDESDYRKVLAYFRALNPHVRVVGLSATPYRVGLGMITDGTLFSDVAYDITGLAAFNNLIDEGYLVPLIPIQTKTILNVAGVAKSGGDFVAAQLQAAVNREDLTRSALTETVRAAADRKHWLIFGAGVEHVEAIAKMLVEEFGVPTAVVHGKLPVAARDEAIRRFKTGEVRALVNANVLTTGFDFPALDCIVALRPTNSVVLHVQILGRGTRTFYAPGFDLETTEGRRMAIEHSPKRNCIAKGELVLTDTGLVPIELVTTSMRVWDGAEWVNHSGVVCQGEQNVIRYAGLGATGEHRVYTEKGWKSFRCCRRDQTPICVTGIGRRAVRQTTGYVRGGDSQRHTEYSPPRGGLRRLWDSFCKNLPQCKNLPSWLPAMFQTKIRAKVVVQSLHSGSPALHKSQRSALGRLWWSWNQILISICDGLRQTHDDFAEFRQSTRHGQRVQQQALRAGKHALVYTGREYVEPTQSCVLVYDILNAGPRHRFTVNGLLVSNCLVLDFAGNVTRLGPVNDPRIPKAKGKGKGEMPVKLCDYCSCLNHISARKCDNCGEEFTIEEKITEQASTAVIVAQADPPRIERFPVSHITLEKHSRPGIIDCLKVSYYCGVQRFTEYVLLEHKHSPIWHKAEKWWRDRSHATVPESIGAAISLEHTLAKPTHIDVWANRKKGGKISPEVWGHVFPPKPSA